MFNFDTTFTKGKNTYTVIKNETAQVIDGKREGWLSISAVAGNALIRHWLDKVIIPQVNKKTPSTDFDTLVKEIEYLMAGIRQVKLIKSTNCSYSNKSLEEVEIEAESIKNNYCKRIQESNFSHAQQLVLRSISNRDISVSSCDIQELYNPVTDDDSKLTKWWKELNAFNYKKYGVSKEAILKEKDCFYEGNCYGSKAHATYYKVVLRVEAFRSIVADAGDDLINWTDHKISRRSSLKAWELAHYTDLYCKHLAKKGIKKVDKNKSTAKGKLKDIVEKGEPTQEEYFRYYKQANGIDATAMIKHLDLEHLYKIIESDLKCVTSKLTDKWGNEGNDFSLVAQFLCEKSVTKQDYQKIIKWATPKNVNEAFMIKHRDHTSVTKVIEYCKTARISHTEFINEEFYQTCLAKIPTNDKYKLNEGLTYQYMVRMNDSDKIEILKQLASPNNNNHTSDDTLHGLYAGVDYSLIKDTILKDDALKQYMCGIVINDNDNESMIKIGTSVANQLDEQHKVGMFNKLSFDEKKVIIKADRGGNNFTGGIKTLTNDESLELLSEIINSEQQSYTTAIFKHLKGTKLAQASKIVSAMDNPDYLPLNSDVIKKLTVDAKIELLNNGISLKDASNYYSYSNEVAKTSSGLGLNFFSDFKRQDIDKVYQNPMHCEYSKFLAHTMTKAELEQCVDAELNYWNKNTHNLDLSESFLRHNLDLLGYGYVKQFKEKESFRIVVGDRRDRSNKSFGQRLLDKMNVTQSIDFMFS